MMRGISIWMLPQLLKRNFDISPNKLYTAIAPPLALSAVVLIGQFAIRETWPNYSWFRLAVEAAPAAGELSTAVTVTFSPEAKRRAGTHAVPAPAGSAVRRPVWVPVRVPDTVTVLSSEGLRAEKITCEAGDASGVPGNGITAREGLVARVRGHV